VMPFKSSAQRAWMYANHPEMAKRWEAETPSGRLPEHVRHEKKARHRKGLLKPGRLERIGR